MVAWQNLAVVIDKDPNRYYMFFENIYEPLYLAFQWQRCRMARKQDDPIAYDVNSVPLIDIKASRLSKLCKYIL